MNTLKSFEFFWMTSITIRGYTFLMHFSKNKTISELQAIIAPLTNELHSHAMYSSIKNIDHVLTFMSHHVYSVWDFMNLLKTLQRELTCVSVPWRPVAHVENARLINEIVLEEESDEIDNEITSHFMYYVNALRGLQETHPIESFLTALESGASYTTLIQHPSIPDASQAFLSATRSIVKQGPIAVVSAFTFGRETLIPGMFTELIEKGKLSENAVLLKFVQYLERHIELDGEQHSHLALQMVENMCSTKEDWALAECAAIQALEARIKFWDGINEQLQKVG